MHKKHFAFILTVLGLLTFGLDAARAAIFETDDRIIVDTTPGSPFAPIGIVYRGDIGQHYTTGTLIGRCHVLTSQHLFGWRSPIGRRVTFSAAVGSPYEVSSRGTVMAAGGYEQHPTASEWSEATGEDWLVVRLDRCLGNSLGYAKLRTSISRPGELSHLSSAGYPADHSRRAGLVVDPTCQVRKVYALVWLNDCAALPGNSGGPLFRILADGGRDQLQVYAIQSRGYQWRGVAPFRSGEENAATPATMFASPVEEAIKASDRPAHFKDQGNESSTCPN